MPSLLFFVQFTAGELTAEDKNGTPYGVPFFFIK